MADVGVKLKVDGEKEFRQAIKDCDAAYKEFGSELKLEQAQLEKTGDKQKFLADQADTLSKMMSTQKEKVSALSTQLEKAKDVYGENSTQVRDLQTKLNNAKTELTKLETQEKKNVEETDKLTKSFKDNDKTSVDLSGAWNGLKTAGAAIGAAMAAVGAAAVAAGKQIFDMATDVASTGDNIDKMSQKIGISTTAYQEWAYVLERSGTNIDNLQTGMKKLSGVIDDAAKGSKSAADKFAAIGLSIEDIAGKSQEEQLQMVISALQDMEAGAERTAAATDLLGSAATDMAAVLNMSSEETATLKQEAEDYGMIMSEQAVSASAAFEDSLTRLQSTIGGVKNSLIAELLPGITQIMDGFAGLVAGQQGAEETLKAGVQSVVEALSTILPTLLQMLPTMITTLIKALIDLFPQLITTVVELFGQVVDMLLECLPQLIPVVLDAVLTIAGKLIEELPTIISAAIQIIVAVVQGITQALPQLIPATIEAVLTIVDSLIDNLPMILSAALQLILALATGLIEALPSLIARLPEIIISLVDFLVGSIPEIISAGTKLLVSLITNLPTIITEIVKAIPQIVQGIFEAFTNPETLAQIADAGMQLIYGLWDGICSVGQWLFDMVGDFFGGIGDFVCGIFGIHSPSKVFADIGKNLMLGMEEGIDGEEQDLLKDVNSLAGEISDAMTVSGNVNLAGTNGNRAKTGSIINIYPQELDNSTVDYLFQRFNAQMGATV